MQSISPATREAMSTTLLPTIDTTKPRRRRWIPLSLKIFAAILAILSAGAGWNAWQIYRLQVAIRAIEGSPGCQIWTRHGDADWMLPWIGVDLLEKLDPADFVCVNHVAATDDLMGHLGRLTSLRSLYLVGAEVTDARLAHLAGLKELESAELSFNPITDAGLIPLKKLPKLKSVSLVETNVTSAGVAELQQALPGCKIRYE